MRKRHVPMYDGQALSNTGTHGQENCDRVRALRDRSQRERAHACGGTGSAARYAFALADPVVGGVRAPTALAAIAPPPPTELPTPKSAEPKRMSFWTIFIMGWLFGFITRGDATTTIQARQLRPLHRDYDSLVRGSRSAAGSG